MKRIWIGIISGVIFGFFDVMMILPMSFPNKEMVLLGAFSNRFAIGLFAATVQLGLPSWLQGVVVGLIISVLPAVSNPGVTGMILGFGATGGLIVSLIASKFTSKKKR